MEGAPTPVAHNQSLRLPILRHLGRGSAVLDLRAYGREATRTHRLRLLARRKTDDAEAEAAELVQREAPITVHRPAILGGVAPTAATAHE